MWSNPRIQINIPSSPTVLADDLPQAMVIWNQAIKWFESTYYPMDESYYSFISSPNGAGTTFQAVNGQTFCSTASNISVCALFTINSDSRYITNAYVEILASELTTSNPAHLSLAVAALGTLIGLIQYTHCPFQDLMCSTLPSGYPSTLDLYAARILAKGNPATNVTLPTSIPYQQAPVVPVPEFHGTSLLISFIAIFSALILLRRSKTKFPRKCYQNPQRV